MDLVNAYLTCPACGAAGRFEPADGEHLRCAGCGAGFGAAGGIVDLVAGRARTALDDIDYDERYAVDHAVDGTYPSLCRETGGLLDRRFDSVLEIGAGSGGFTVGMLQGGDIGAAVVTDVSPAMLARCRDRIAARGLDARVPVLFQTNDGARLNVQDGRFDLVVGYFVVHHILDYRRFVAACHAALRPGGIAVFAEPNLNYHRASLRALDDTLPAILAQRGTWAESDRLAILNTAASLNMTVKFQDDPEIKAGWEDKHVFSRADMEGAARAAGFARARSLPYGRDLPVELVPLAYARQMGLGDEAAARFARELAADFAEPLALLDPLDRTPSTVFVFEKGERGDARAAPPAAREPSAPVAAADDTLAVADLRHDLIVTAGDGTLRVFGWIIGPRSIGRIEVEMAGRRLVAPVGHHRVDVWDVHGGDRRYRTRDVLFSGVDHAMAASGIGDGQARIAAVTTSGRRIELADALRVRRGKGRLSR